MRNKLESIADRSSWGEVVTVGFMAVLVLLVLAAWANEATQNFASCNPPGGVHLGVGQVYVCPTKYSHYWTVHTHAALVYALLAGAVAVAIGTAVLAVCLARRRRPPVVGAI